jgi:hypothetical protein
VTLPLRAAGATGAVVGVLSARRGGSGPGDAVAQNAAAASESSPAAPASRGGLPRDVELYIRNVAQAAGPFLHAVLAGEARKVRAEHDVAAMEQVQQVCITPTNREAAESTT